MCGKLMMNLFPFPRYIPYDKRIKRCKDLLTKDYTCDREVTFSTVTASGVCLTSTAEKKVALCSLDIN